MIYFFAPDHGDAADFRRRAEAHLNGSVVAIRVQLDYAPQGLGEVAAAVHLALADEELEAECRAAGVDELDDLRRSMAARDTLDAGVLTPADEQALAARLRWMLTEPEVFYPSGKTPATPAEAEALSGGFLRWFLAGKGPSWKVACLDPRVLVGFADNFYDSAWVAWRGVELRILVQNGSD